MVRGIQRQPIALLAVCAALSAAEPPAARELLERLVSAEAANRRLAEQFVYREDVRQTLSSADGTTLELSWITYEVNMLEGEPYHRRVAMAGRPLPPEQEELERRRYHEVEAWRRSTPLEERRRQRFAAEENRFKIDHRLVVEHHVARLVGEGELGGRKVWFVLATPAKGTPKPTRRAEWSLSQSLKYTLDQETGMALEVEAVQLYTFDSALKGAVTTVTSTEVDGAWLPAKTESRSVRNKSTHLTTQTYTNYKRFRATSTLLVEPE